MPSDMKKSDSDNWNFLADRFNTYKKTSKVHPDVAVNVVVGWPIFFKVINKETTIRKKNSLRILDFGCGTGEFCRKLAEFGHRVVGVDQSKRMLEIARPQVSGFAEVLEADHKNAFFNLKVNLGSFDVVTAIHSLEWIEDVEVALANLARVLAPRGLLVFAVFPKDHVKDSLCIGDLFEDFDSLENPTAGYANFDGIRVPVWIRSQDEYDRFLNDLGFTRVLFYEPDYPRGFIDKYKWKGSKFPEMMIMAYRKV